MTSWKSKFPIENKYLETLKGILYHADSTALLKQFPDNSVDTILTDPPYGLGFMGKEWDTFNKSAEYHEWVKMWATELLRVAKPGALLFSFGGPRTFHRLACGIEDAGWQIRDTLMWLYGSGIPKGIDISKQIDKKLGAERKIIATGKNNKKTNLLTEPATLEAKIWNGYRSALKPAYEPIILAMKPLEGTFADNALKWGVAGLNIDAGRIPHNEPVKYTQRQKNKGNSWNAGNTGLRSNPSNIASPNPKGRFPANILLDEISAEMLDEQAPRTGQIAPTTGNEPSMSKKVPGKPSYPRDPLSGASRFFYVAKADVKEREMGLEHMPARKGIRINAPRKSEEEKTKPRKNNHPSVKPITLIRYLVRLASMPNPDQIYLDLFAGTGTTAVACEMEGKHWIAIEKEEEYCEIIKGHISAVPLTLF
jgi:DNA modification methylase